MTRLFERVIGEGQDSSEELPENDMIPRKSYRRMTRFLGKLRRMTRFLGRVIGE